MLRYLTALTVFLFAALSASGQPVSGVVLGEGKGIAGVVVTDGYGFTQTGHDGRFTIDPNPDAEFVYITTPSGYSAPVVDGATRFYAELAGLSGEAVFELEKLGNGTGYALFAVADPQTSTDRHFKRFRNETEPDMMTLAAEYRASGVQPVGIYLGDIVWDNMGLLPMYRDHIERLGFPVYAVIGNHDYDQHKQGDDETSREFRENFGPLYYGFNLAGNHFIVLDNIVYDTQKKYRETIDDRQMAWLEGYLRYIPAGEKVYVAMHAPIANPAGKVRLDRGRELLELLSGYDVSFLTGHAHLNHNCEPAPGVWEHNIGSAGGSWWLDDWSRDGTPNGYKVFEFSGRSVKHYFKATGHPADFRHVTYDRGTFMAKPKAVAVKIWDYDTRWKIEWYEDGIYKGEMERFLTVDPEYCSLLTKLKAKAEADGKEFKLGTYRYPHARDFYFAAVPGSQARVVEIVITDRDGRVSREVIDLAGTDAKNPDKKQRRTKDPLETMMNAVRTDADHR